MLDVLTQELETCSPREACGFLLGCAGGAWRVAPTLNAMAGISAFAIPDHEVHRVRALAGQEKLVAVYYSPPSGQTQLSDADRTALQHATLPWLIVTVEELIGYAPRSAAPIAVTVNVHPERLPVPCDNEAMH